METKTSQSTVVFREPVKNIDSALVHETPQESIARSRDMALYILLRDMQGGSNDLGSAIRELAENAAENHRVMDVLEAGNGAPFKTLYFQEDIIRNRGDFMIYGTHKHDKPQVRSTIIANADYVKGILEGQYNLDDRTEFDLIGEHLNGMMGYPAEYKRHDEQARRLIKTAYEAKKREGLITLYTNTNLVAALKESYRDGKRYDLAFPDLEMNVDRMNMLQVVQASLKPNGYAFIPVTWWRPDIKIVKRSQTKWDLDDLSLGMKLTDDVPTEYARDMVRIDDTVSDNGKETPFEDYLSQKYPNTFQIGHYPGAKTLIVRGTRSPIQLPNFDAQIRTENKLTDGGVAIKWIVK